MSFASAWLWRRPRLGLAFTERFLLALRLDPSGRGPEDGTGSLKRELPEGMVKPGPVTPNIESVREVARVASEMVAALSGRRGRRPSLSLALPDLSVVTALFPSNGSDVAGGEPGAKLASRLGFPSSEARLDFWRGRKGEVLGAAVRGAVVRQYEQIAEAIDCPLSWVDGASLVRLPLWTEASAVESGVGLRVQLYRTHYHVATFHAGELVDIRTRLRSQDDVEAVTQEIRRLPTLSGLGAVASVVFTGEGAAACARSLESREDLETRDHPSLGRVSAAEEGEETQLAAVLGALLGRSS